ncbi:MAG TPA: SET domain-containing protein-lysine N-methyltransferase [Candidatus Saccharimonas sp.]|nr:SET domain-containing protein-lysine N-methyltransferase [Candidatus Saccharimonas sp.]
MTKITEFSFEIRYTGNPQIGSGVFATHSIEAGAIIPGGILLPRRSDCRVLHESDFPSGLKHYTKYCVAKDVDEWYCPWDFARMENGWRLNHADEHAQDPAAQPSLRIGPDWELEVVRFIAADDEVRCDYNQFGEPIRRRKPYYYKGVVD